MEREREWVEKERGTGEKEGDRQGREGCVSESERERESERAIKWF